MKNSNVAVSLKGQKESQTVVYSTATCHETSHRSRTEVAIDFLSALHYDVQGCENTRHANYNLSC